MISMGSAFAIVPELSGDVRVAGCPATEAIRCPRGQYSRRPKAPPGSLGIWPPRRVLSVGPRPTRVLLPGESLADALLHRAAPGAVYTRRDRAYENPEVAHTARGRLRRPRPKRSGRAPDPWLKTNDLSRTPLSIANPLGNGLTRIICPPFGIEERVVASWSPRSPRADFLTEVDRLLLSVAANQVAILLGSPARAEDALRESIAVGIAHCDFQGAFPRVNQTLCEIVGYTREELFQKTWQEITHPDDLGSPASSRAPYPCGASSPVTRWKSGASSRPARWSGSIWPSRSNATRRARPVASSPILQDISERKRLEQERNRANARLELVPWRPEHRHLGKRHARRRLPSRPDKPTSISGSSSATDGHPIPRPLRGQAYSDPPRGLRPVEEACAVCSYLAGETSEYEVEFRGRHKDGSHCRTLARGVAARCRGSRFVSWAAQSTSPTASGQRSCCARARSGSAAPSRTPPSALPKRTPSRRFLRVNEKFCAIVGYPREELLQRTFQDITHPDELAVSLEPFTALMRGESLDFELEKRYLRQDGSLVWVAAGHPAPCRDAAGSAPGYLIAIIRGHFAALQAAPGGGAARERERRFRTFVDHATDAFFLLDEQHVPT